MRMPSVYLLRRAASLISALALLLPNAATTRANPAPQNSSVSVPQWTSLRIRMDDTLTSKYSMERDPFSATVMDQGMYQGARVYGTIQTIDNSGRFRGDTTTILVFNRLMMPDGQRAPISAEIVKLYHAPSGEFVDVEGAIESSGRGKSTFVHTAIGAGAGALLGGIFGGGKGAGIGSIIGGAGLGTTAFTGPQDVKLDRGMEMLIRITNSTHCKRRHPAGSILVAQALLPVRSCHATSTRPWHQYDIALDERKTPFSRGGSQGYPRQNATQSHILGTIATSFLVA